MKDFAVFLINFYQKYLSPDQSIFSHGRKFCNFEPTCSEYIKSAVSHGGIIYGAKKGITRIIKCHPFQKNIIDPFHP